MTRADRHAAAVEGPWSPAPARCRGCGCEVEHGSADEHPLCGGDHCEWEQEESEATADLAADGGFEWGHAITGHEVDRMADSYLRPGPARTHTTTTAQEIAQ